mmetsp:Transcript_4888/g.5307  ORF Transcript_4888/g.5307 Transcript_4888/m.5307 type:complete len:100 (+) Transcript_4888:1217-1516(+)
MSWSKLPTPSIQVDNKFIVLCAHSKRKKNKYNDNQMTLGEPANGDVGWGVEKKKKERTKTKTKKLKNPKIKRNFSNINMMLYHWRTAVLCSGTHTTTTT